MRVRPWLLCLAFAGLVASLAVGIAQAEMTTVPTETQYIAALGDPSATSGTDAQDWGLWTQDPGPRGVWTKSFAELMSAGGKAPSGWQFNPTSWWLEEHGLIMETPGFPLPPGSYLVTGGREWTSVLTVDEPDAEGRQAWRLAFGATLYDVTHLRCRAALYTAKAGQSCTPDKTPTGVFPMDPGRSMPEVEGCSKTDYQVLIVLGRVVGS